MTQNSDEGQGENVCPDCGGSGQVDDRECQTCEGTGTVVEPIGGA
jgi:DnaJ-class molecular chaperone